MLPSINVPPKHLAVSVEASSNSKRANFRGGSKTKGAEKSNERTHNESLLLPLISEGSFASLVSSKSSKARWKERRKQSDSTKSRAKMKQRGGGFREYPDMNPVNESRAGERNPGVKTTHLQLNHEFGNIADKGWSLQNPNPRLTRLQNVTGRFQAAVNLNYVNIPNYTEFTRTVAAPHVEFLYHRKQRKVKEKAFRQEGRMFMTTSGVQAALNDRYKIPPITSSPTEIETSPPHPILDSPSRGVPETACIHKKNCGCGRVHGTEKRVTPRVSSQQNGRDRGPATPQRKFSLQSSSSSSLQGYPHRLRPDGPPPSPPKLPQNKSRGMSLTHLRRKARKVLAGSESFEIIYDKRRKSSVTIPSTPNRTKKPRNKQEINANNTTNEAQPTENIEQEVQVTMDCSQMFVARTEKETVVREEQTSPKRETPVEMEVDNACVLPLDNVDECDNKTVVESISTVTTPRSVRRVTTPKLLKINPDHLQSSTELTSLQKMFSKLDRDGDGHLSFAELMRSLPSDLTNRQIAYIKKIYLLACESTYFGMEEFLAVREMCGIISHIGYSVFQTFDSVDINRIEDSISLYMELFHDLDKSQSGSISVDSFKDLLSSAMNVYTKSSVLQKVLNTMGKENGDCVSSIELLAFLPYFISESPKNE